MRISRGDIYLVSPSPANDPKRARAVVIVSRQTLCDSIAVQVVCAPVNTNADGRTTEVPVGVDEGLKHESVINCDQLILVRRAVLTDYRGALGKEKLRLLRDALRIAVALE
ncbi:MAG: type II toxin-antitoxin system PemK/MazF family toxin [Gemmatimonadaceae bacterium]